MLCHVGGKRVVVVVVMVVGPVYAAHQTCCVNIALKPTVRNNGGHCRSLTMKTEVEIQEKLS
jgi:hypothetical protein